MILTLDPIPESDFSLLVIPDPDSDPVQSGTVTPQIDFPFQSLLEMHSAAGEEKDAHLCSFVEENYLDEQVNIIIIIIITLS